MEKYVAHYISRYLPLTEVWLYNLIRSHEQFKPVVLCRKKTNEDKFPVNNVNALQDLSALQKLYDFAVFKSIGYFPHFRGIMEKYSCQLLHAHFGYHAVKSVKLAKTLKVPLVCSFYGGDVFKYTTDPNNVRNYRKLFNAFSKGFVLGPYMKETLMRLGCPEEKLVINHLGVDIDSIGFEPRYYEKDRQVKFLIASSFVEKKGIDIALKALKSIEKEVDFTIDIIGDGPLKHLLVSLISELKLGHKVVLHGYKPYQFFLELAAKCDVYIQASKTAQDHDKEGTPMAIIDAMATGMPVVATRHSDIPEIVIDGLTGFLAEENNVSSLSEAIFKMIKHRFEMNEFSHRCRTRVENEFNLHKQIKKLESLYASVI